MALEYLYGASCQGIQSYIFETNTLKEIVGGSDLVERLCTTFFSNFLKDIGVDSGELISAAAGNIRYRFSEGDAQKVVRKFPLHASQFVPGLTISQAVVRIGDVSSGEAFNELERNLHIQRNRPQRPFDIGFIATQRCRRTARPAVPGGQDGMVDKALMAKRRARSMETLVTKLVPERVGSARDIPLEMEDMVDRQKSGWLAVIHADGNSVGQCIQESIRQLENKDENIYTFLKDFSRDLDAATVAAAQRTFGLVILKDDYINNGKFPIRPVIIGGDDVTVICRADLAVEFTQKYLIEFEKQTKTELGRLAEKYKIDAVADGLTASAGIAFIKPKYPFHYAVSLAENLCGKAKLASKRVENTKNPPSSLAFYKVRSTFLDSPDTMYLREATVSGVSLEYGPYAVQNIPEMPSVDLLLSNLDLLKRDDAPDSSLRQWLSVLSRSRAQARQYLIRMKEIVPWYYEKLGLSKAIENNSTPIGDWLSLLSLEKGE